MSRPAFFPLAVALLAGLVSSARADIQTVTNTPVPTRLRPAVLVLAADWSTRIPPASRVNAPDILQTLYPGQRIAVSLMAEGTGRDQLLGQLAGKVHFTVQPGGAGQTFDLQPASVRQIKAEGADMALIVLTAGGISGADRAKMEAATSLTSLAVLTPDWTVPAGQTPMEVEIRVELSGPSAVAIEPLRLPVKPAADWLKEPPLTAEAIGKQVTRYRGNLAPGQLLAWLQATAKTSALRSPAVHGFFAFCFQSSAPARIAAVENYPALEPEAQGALLWLLKLGGADLPRLFPSLPAETLARYDEVAPLPDPRKLTEFRDPVELEAVKQLGNTMDLCWAGWMATGDQSYLRTLAGLLAHPDDFAVLKAWQQSRGGEKGLNARVANGLAYQIAGWSIGSFQRSDPLVADWLAFWRNDSGVPEIIRREIATLAANPAFQRK